MVLTGGIVVMLVGVTYRTWRAVRNIKDRFSETVYSKVCVCVCVRHVCVF